MSDMQNWEGLYLELSTLIETELTEIKHIDLFAEQPMAASEGGEYPYPEPAIFIDINTAQDDEVGADVVQGDTIVTFWVQLSSLADSHKGSVNRTESLEILRLMDRLQKVVHGVSGNHFSALTRVGRRREQALPMTHLYAIDYRCIMTDYTAQEQHTGTEFDELGVLKGEVTIPGPDEDPLFDLDDSYDPATDTGGVPPPPPVEPDCDPVTVVSPQDDTLDGSVNAGQQLSVRVQDSDEQDFSAGQVQAMFSANLLRMILANYNFRIIHAGGGDVFSVLRSLEPSVTLVDKAGVPMPIIEVDDSGSPNFTIRFDNKVVYINGSPVIVFPASDAGASLYVTTPEGIPEGSWNESEQRWEVPASTVANPGGIVRDYHPAPQSQKNAQMKSSSYFELGSNNFFGHQFRFTGKTGGYYDGSFYRDVNGSVTTKELAFPDSMVLIHDMTGVYNETNKYVLCMRTALAGSKSYNQHVTDSDALMYGGIGPNRWFLGSMEWFYLLAQNQPTSEYILGHAPFTDIGTEDLLWTDTQYVDGSSRLCFRQRYNIPLQRSTSLEYRSIYWCWFDLENDI